MKEQTDLNAVKALAHAMLELDIEQTRLSPLVVKHPFTDNGISGVRKPDGSLAIADLLNKPDDLALWRKQVGSVIDEADSAVQIYMMVTKSYALGFLKFARNSLSEKDFAELLADAWIRTEAPNNDPNLSKRDLLSLFKATDPTLLMDEEDYQQFQDLDDVVTVYRGVTSMNAKNVKALSWTLDRDTAEWFAHRFGENGTVYEAQIQKKFTVDFLTKKQKVNEGEVPQYYVEGSHPAIISAMDFDRVQAEIARRQSLGRSYSGSSIFASKLICGDCGGFYGKKIWHSTDAYRREIWRCNGKFSGEAKCETPTLTTEGIQQMFLRAYNQLMGNREQVIQACEVMREVVANCTALDAEIDALNEEIQVVAGLVSQCIKENATTQQSQDEYNKKYNRLVKRYEKAVERLNKATAEKESKMQRDRELRIFIGAIKEQPLVLEAWDEGLWLTLLETATVHADNRITFRFKDGTDIEVGAE